MFAFVINIENKICVDTMLSKLYDKHSSVTMSIVIVIDSETHFCVNDTVTILKDTSWKPGPRELKLLSAPRHIPLCVRGFIAR